MRNFLQVQRSHRIRGHTHEIRNVYVYTLGVAGSVLASDASHYYEHFEKFSRISYGI
jgi:hypothetical protein